MFHFLKAPMNWIAKRHAIWVAFPFSVLLAFATFPSKFGIICAGLAWLLFMLCLFGWRLNAECK